MPGTLPVVETDESHSVTTLELFFDLVFVFALTQVTAVAAANTSASGLAQALIVLALLWWAWCSYSWLGNQARADEGALRACLIVAMAGMFVCALSIPNAFQQPGGGYIEPWLFAVAYAAVRMVHIGVYLVAAGDDLAMRWQLIRTGISVSIAAAILIIGAFAPARWQVGIWLLALVVDYLGIYVTGTSGWRVPAPGHFAERYGLVVIIALGESLVAIGVGIGAFKLTIPLVIGALLGLSITISLWWLYFDVVALVGERVLAKSQGQERARLARDSYTYLHFPMILGIAFLALGLKKAMGYLGDETSTGGHVSVITAVALCAGPALYLAGHVGFRWRNLHSFSRPRLTTIALLLLLIPVCAVLKPLAAVGIVAAVSASLVAYEAIRYAAARDRVRHKTAV